MARHNNQKINSPEMNERTLFWIAGVCSTIGLAAIILLPLVIGLADIKISELTDDDLGKKVSITGDIKFKVQKDSLTIIEINDGTGKIEAVFFERIFLKKEKATIIGVVSKYKGNLQIKASDIR